MTTKQTQAKYKTPNQLNTKTSYVTVIEELINSIGQETNTKKILGTILPYALTISKTEAGTLLVAGDEPNNLSAVAIRGISDEVITQLTKGDLGHLLLLGKRLWVKPQPLQLDPEQALLGRHKLKYLFGVPFYFKGRALGAIVVGSHTKDEDSLHLEQQHQLTTLAHLAALFLDDIRLRTTSQHPIQQETVPEPNSLSDSTPPPTDELEQLLAAVMSAEEEVVSQNSDLGLLNELSNEVGSTLQLDSILQAAVKQAKSALNAEVGWCYLMKDRMLTLHEHQGLSGEYVAGMQHLTLGDGVEGMAFSRNETILRDAVLFHSGRARILVQKEGLRVVAAVPLRAGNEPFGVLAVAKHRDQPWSSRDKRMLSSIGTQVSRAITNSQKFTEIEEKVQTWETNYQTLQQSNTQLTERVQTLEQQIDTLRQIERRIWNVLGAASNKTPHQPRDSGADEQLATTLKDILSTKEKGKPAIH